MWLTGTDTRSENFACDRLRCVKCDFRVIVFPDAAWNDRCDYLFLRNNMPVEDKLAINLIRQPGNYTWLLSVLTSQEQMRMPANVPGVMYLNHRISHTLQMFAGFVVDMNYDEVCL